MINGIVINKSKLGKKPIGHIIETEKDFYDQRFKNIVMAYINNLTPVLIKTNLSQSQFDLFTEGKLSYVELEKYI